MPYFNLEMFWGKGHGKRVSVRVLGHSPKHFTVID